MISSAGIFYSCTSFLPSSTAAVLVMLSIASWLNSNYLGCIFYGCIAVCWLGWPFVGLLFVPIGIPILYDTFQQKGLRGPLNLCVSGLMVLIAVLTPSILIDMAYYQKLTSPLLNIIKYNALGSGDNLYGTENISYYIYNLFLMCGLAWPLAVIVPLINIRDSINASSRSLGKDKIIGAAAAIWIYTMFSRPHKEERFIYPIYPLISFMAAISLCSLIDFLGHK